MVRGVWKDNALTVVSSLLVVNSSDCEIIICGDFNSEPHYESMKIIPF